MGTRARRASVTGRGQGRDARVVRHLVRLLARRRAAPHVLVRQDRQDLRRRERDLRRDLHVRHLCRLHAGNRQLVSARGALFLSFLLSCSLFSCSPLCFVAVVAAAVAVAAVPPSPPSFRISARFRALDRTRAREEPPPLGGGPWTRVFGIVVVGRGVALSVHQRPPLPRARGPLPVVAASFSRPAQNAVVWCGEFLMSLSLNGDLNYLDASTPATPTVARVVQAPQASDRCCFYTSAPWRMAR